MMIASQNGGEVVNFDRFDRIHYKAIETDFEKALEKAVYEVVASRNDVIETYDTYTTQGEEITLGLYNGRERAKSEVDAIAAAINSGKAIYYLSDKE